MSLVLLLILATTIGVSMGFSGIGGFLVVPLMIVVADSSPAQAVFTALAANLGVTLTNGLFAIGRGQIAWRVFQPLVAGSVAGAFVGVWLVSTISPTTARFVIAVFLVGLGIVSIRRQRAHFRSRDRELPGTAAFGLGIAAQASALLVGIGGPAITVPVLASSVGRAERVVGTALLHGVIVSSLGLVITGLAGASPSWLVAGIAVLIVASSLLASIWRTRILELISLRPFVGVMALVGAAVLLFAK